MSCTLLHRNATQYKSVVSYVLLSVGKWEKRGCVKQRVGRVNQIVYFLMQGMGVFE